MTFYTWTAVLVCALIAVVDISASDENEVSVVRGNNAFGLQWFQMENEKPNSVVISPLSAETVLAMLGVGAQGSTFSEIAKGLQLPQDKGIIAKGFRSLITSILKAGEANATLDTANRIYLDSTYVIEEDYNNTVQEYFLAEIISTNFKGNPEGSRKSINQWVEDKTHDRIQDLLPPDVINTDTLTVLVNVIYFKDAWKRKFNKKLTRKSTFSKSCNEVSEVEMMDTTDSLPLAEFEDFQALQLDYQSDNLHMLVILPRSCEDGSGRLSKIMKNINLTEVHDSLIKQRVHVNLPKFRVEQTMELNEVLQELGMRTMYTDQADFSGISTSEGMKVSTAIQKTFVEVNEEGTEAAAATAVVGVRLTAVGIEPPIKQFIADHYFTWFIIEKSSQAVLFVGSYKGSS